MFPKGISQKVNLIEQSEFELTHYEITVLHISHYTIGDTSSSIFTGKKKFFFFLNKCVWFICCHTFNIFALMC